MKLILVFAAFFTTVSALTSAQASEVAVSVCKIGTLTATSSPDRMYVEMHCGANLDGPRERLMLGNTTSAIKAQLLSMAHANGKKVFIRFGDKDEIIYVSIEKTIPLD